jgi:hypothetical protein
MRSRVVGMVGARCAPLVPTLPLSSHTRCLLSQGIPEGAGLLLNPSSGCRRFDSYSSHRAEFPVRSGACLLPFEHRRASVKCERVVWCTVGTVESERVKDVCVCVCVCACVWGYEHV